MEGRRNAALTVPDQQPIPWHHIQFPHAMSEHPTMASWNWCRGERPWKMPCQMLPCILHGISGSLADPRWAALRACENAGGHYFRNLCSALQKAIQERAPRSDVAPSTDDDALAQPSIACVSCPIGHESEFGATRAGGLECRRSLPKYTAQTGMLLTPQRTTMLHTSRRSR